MKNKTKLSFRSVNHAFSGHMITNKLISLGNSSELLELFKRHGWSLLASTNSKITKSTNRLIQLHNFGKYLLQMVKFRGATTTVIYLKACQLAVQKKIAKDRITSLRDLQPDLALPRLSHSGLPRIIPLGDRRAICNGSVPVIRWWLTIFSVYRVIQIPGKLKLNTITDVFTGNKEKLDLVSKELKAIALSSFSSKPISWNPVSFLLLETSSPTHKVAWAGLVKDLILLYENNLHSDLMLLIGKFGKGPMVELSGLIMDLYAKLGPDHPYLTTKMPLEKDNLNSSIGQLSIKEEAAGKVRVFAMVDVWTQSTLKPLHDFLFSFLKSLPNDGTFDQQESVNRCFVKSKVAKCSFGYDLSAATDRLPIEIQVSILSVLLGDDGADAWKRLLVDRDYTLTSKKYGNHTVKYSVGQPMGALSSWAMLAVTHHFLVQIAAHRAGLKRPGQWYDNYELLGDDINIFNELVAIQYLSIMEDLGVPINLSKSVVAKTEAFEFAKVTGFKGANVSAISWKMFMSQSTMMGRANIIYSLVNKNIITSHPIRQAQNIIKSNRHAASNLSFSYVALMTMYANAGKLSFENLIKSFMDKASPTRLLYKNLLKQVRLPYLENTLAKLMLGQTPTFDTDSCIQGMWYMDESWFKWPIYKKMTDLLQYLEDVRQLKIKEDSWSEKISIDMLRLIFPKTSDFEEALLVWWTGTENSITEDVYYIKRVLEGMVAVKGDPILEKLGQLRPTGFVKKMNNDLDGFIKLGEELDRFSELKLLVNRALVKLDGGSKKVMEDSPLSVLRFIVKGRKGRPLSSYYNPKAKE